MRREPSLVRGRKVSSLPRWPLGKLGRYGLDPGLDLPLPLPLSPSSTSSPLLSRPRLDFGSGGKWCVPFSVGGGACAVLFLGAAPPFLGGSYLQTFIPPEPSSPASRPASFLLPPLEWGGGDTRDSDNAPGAGFDGGRNSFSGDSLAWIASRRA